MVRVKPRHPAAPLDRKIHEAGGHGATRWTGIGFGCDPSTLPFAETVPADLHPTLPLPSLSPVGGKAILGRRNTPATAWPKCCTSAN